jgi:hypothetical protein
MALVNMVHPGGERISAVDEVGGDATAEHYGIGRLVGSKYRE